MWILSDIPIAYWSCLKRFALKGFVVHIECFDNSNIQGTNPVRACVVFKNAKPSKGDYRKFNEDS
ncbi:MAG: hypothetical protein R2809_12845 [Flavobacteriales bacterium]